jgi:aquaporin Z
MAAGFVCELVMTAMFVLIILGATDHRAPKGLAPIAIGLALTLIHLISIPVTNTSVNPARSTGPALIVGGWAIQQLWMFWLAPILGAVVGGGPIDGWARRSRPEARVQPCRYGRAALASSAYARIPTRSRARKSSTAFFSPGWRR